MNAAIMLSEEVKKKLLDLDRYTEEYGRLDYTDPYYSSVQKKCRSLQNELMYDHGLSENQINDLTYGVEGLLYG